MKKGGMELLIFGVGFVAAALYMLIAFSQLGYQPNEAIGQNEVRLLQLKEDAVNKLIQADQALRFAGMKTVNDLQTKMINPDCGYDLNPLITETCTYDKDLFKEYFEKNYAFYTRNFYDMPAYEFEYEFSDKIKVKAQPKENLRVYSEQQYFSVGTTAIFETLPTDAEVLTSCYGQRKLGSEAEQYDFHDGIDFAAKNGNSQAKIFAVEEGFVHSICENDCNLISDTSCQAKCNGYGTNIVIIHPNGFLTRYSHLDAKSLTVIEGNKITKGQEIAKAGNTGYSKAAHLDFKIYSSVNDLGKKDSGLSPLCYFSPDSFTNVVLSAGADSCKIKYSGNLDLNNPPISLLEECNYAMPDADKLGEDIIKRSQRYQSYISQASQDYGVPEALIKAVITQESKFEPDAVSHTGVKGIMQMQTDTAQENGLIVDSAVDERLIPEKAIPAGTRYLKKFYDKYGNNIVPIAISYNAGPGVAIDAINKCGTLTLDNYADCMEDSIRVHYSSNFDKKFQEVTDYVIAVNDYYDWWGGLVGRSASFGSYYEVNPYSETEINFSLSIFEEIDDFAELLIEECSGLNSTQEIKDCKDELLDLYNEAPGVPVFDHISYSCTLFEDLVEKEKIAKFIQEYEECKNYDWDELNAGFACNCNIDYPDISGVDIRILSDRIQFIKNAKPGSDEGEIFYEHESKAMPMFSLNSILYNNRVDFLTFGRDQLIVETLDGYLTLDHKGSSMLIRTEKSVLPAADANNYPVCNAPNKVMSFCYDSAKDFSRIGKDGEYYHDIPAIIPFSVKVE